ITPKLLVFDLLVMDKTNYMNKPLNKRLGCLHEFIMRPYEKMLRKRPELARMRPFKDGLIFTSLKSGYLAEQILKWKPPNENSIDLKLCFDFNCHNENNKPRFCLYKWMNVHRYFDDMYVTDEDWKHDFQQYEGRIVEVVYSPSMNPPWRFKRFRYDLPHANHYTKYEPVHTNIELKLSLQNLEQQSNILNNNLDSRDHSSKKESVGLMNSFL
ncbi:16904_t:CDS:2, partial [Funneliformis caledonium]